ncbi:MAG TPA: two-component regulator propeller domain-containing protein [Candidatus Ozemobacteraceae bacterium]|nr:two-component regulator propeller domain-containing protein [Candidatus Ozemobacteraceae bacterium]
MTVPCPRRGSAWWGAAVILLALLLMNPWSSPAPPQSTPGWLTLARAGQFRALQLEGDLLWAGGRDGLLLVDWRRGIEVALPSGTPLLHGIEALVLDASGTLWVGHERGLAARIDGSWRENPSGMPAGKVMALTMTRSGTVWAGTWNGAARLDNGTWKFLTRQDGLLHDQIKTIFEDSQGGLWFGSYAAPAGGLVRFANSGKTTYAPPDQLPHANVVAMGEDRRHRIWVGTGFFDRGGLTCIEGWATGTAHLKTWGQADGLAGQKCRSIFEDRSGTLWFGSEMDGLTRFDGATFTILTPRDGLGGNEVMSMLQDLDGNLWMATSSGLTRLASSSPLLHSS